jgi:hypothetical protein
MNPKWIDKILKEVEKEGRLPEGVDLVALKNDVADVIRRHLRDAPRYSVNQIESAVSVVYEECADDSPPTEQFVQLVMIQLDK